MAQQDVRYYLNGLLLEITKEKIRAVATDGHRLALCDINASVKTEKKIHVIIPRKGVTELIRLLNREEEEVNVKISKNHIQISQKMTKFYMLVV